MKTRQLLGQFFFICMVMFLLFTIIGGFASYFYVKDFVVDYCVDCIKENCGCDDLCNDDFDGLKSFAYVALTFSILFSLVAAVSFARWTQAMLGYLEKENNGIENQLSGQIQSMPIPDIDPYCCCWCPGVKHVYTMQTLKDTAEDIGDAADATVDAAYSCCEAFFPMLCFCCCMVVYIIAIVLCYSSDDIAGWVRVIACIVAFIIYVFAEGSNY